MSKLWDPREKADKLEIFAKGEQKYFNLFFLSLGVVLHMYINIV